MTDKRKCFENVHDAIEPMLFEDTPDVAVKKQVHVASMLEVSTHRCDEGAYRHPERLQEFARSVVVSEWPVRNVA